MKAICIYHSIDLDGWMSAAIVKHWFLTHREGIDLKYEIFIKEDTNSISKTINGQDYFLDFIGYNYGQPIPDLSEYDKVIMCDISFPENEMEKLRQNLQDNFIWIDHHISAINATKKRLNDYYEGLRDTTFAACELTWKYFFPDERIPEIVRLLGRYDCFGHKGTNEELTVLEFQYGARSVISNCEEAYTYLQKSLEGIQHYDYCGEYTIEDDIHQCGRNIYSYLCTEAKQIYKTAFVIVFTETTYYSMGNESQRDIVKYKFLCINRERFNPVNFGIDYHEKGYDGCACFYFDGENYNFSLYNDNGKVDCSEIAKQFGGGGHKGAAGFRVDNLNKVFS